MTISMNYLVRTFHPCSTNTRFHKTYARLNHLRWMRFLALCTSMTISSSKRGDNHTRTIAVALRSLGHFSHIRKVIILAINKTSSWPAISFHAGRHIVLPCLGLKGIHGRINHTQAPPISLCKVFLPNARLQHESKVLPAKQLSHFKIAQKRQSCASQFYPLWLSRPCWEEVQRVVNRHCHLLGWCRHFEVKSSQHRPVDYRQSSLDFLHLHSSRHSFESGYR